MNRCQADMHFYFSTTASYFELPTSSRLLLGEGLFETLRFEGATVFASYLHWQRLRKSAAYLSIPFPATFADWNALLANAIQQSALASGGLRFTLMNGAANRGLDQRATASDGLIQAFPHTPLEKPLYLVKAPWCRDARNPVYQHKTINYIEAIQARKYAHSQAADDCLFLNTDGYVSETGTANIFTWTGKTLCTPPLNAGLLPGVARHLILDCAAEMGLAVLETPTQVEDIQAAEAVFVSNALQYIRPVGMLEGKTLPQEASMLAELLSALQEAAPFEQYGNEQHAASGE